MSRAVIILNAAADLARAIRWITQAPVGTRLEFKAPKRSLPQNDRFWSMLTDVATQLRWHGQKLTPDDWKLMFLDGLKRELRIVPNLNDDGFVNLSRSSSDLSVEEMSDAMELIAAFGTPRGVVFRVFRDEARAA